MKKIFEEFWRIAQPDDEVDEFEEFESVTPRNVDRPERSRSQTRERGLDTENDFVTRSNSRKRDSGKDRNSSIVELQTNTLQKVVVMEPKEYSEEVKTIADYLCDKHTIFLNLEQTDEDVSRRILDFISGVAYANDGNVRRIATATYVITPFTVTLLDSLMDGLEEKGIFYKS